MPSWRSSFTATRCAAATERVIRSSSFQRSARVPGSAYRARPLIDALGQLDDPRGVDALVVVLRAPEDAGLDFRDVIAAAEALAEVGDLRALAVGPHWTDGTRVAGFVARAAAEAIGKIEGPTGG